jgi:hypothetical protein
VERSGARAPRSRGVLGAVSGTVVAGVGVVAGSAGAATPGAPATSSTTQSSRPTTQAPALASSSHLETCSAEFGLGKFDAQLAQVRLDAPGASTATLGDLRSSLRVEATVESSSGTLHCVASPAWTDEATWRSAQTVDLAELLKLLQPGVVPYPGAGYYGVPSPGHTYHLADQTSVLPTAVSVSVTLSYPGASVSAPSLPVAARNFLAIDSSSSQFTRLGLKVASLAVDQLLSNLPVGDATASKERALVESFFSQSTTFSAACHQVVAQHPHYVEHLLGAARAIVQPEVIAWSLAHGARCDVLGNVIVLAMLAAGENYSLPPDALVVSLPAPTTTTSPTTTSPTTTSPTTTSSPSTPGSAGLAATGLALPGLLLASFGGLGTGVGALALRRRRAR